MMRMRTNFKLWAFAILLCHPLSSHAGGFAILEQSSEGIGVAYAGSAAGYGDGSEIAYNPAAMAWLPETIVSHSSHFIIPSAEFNNEGSNNPKLGGVPLSGSNGPDAGSVAYVPSVFIAGEFFEDVHLGLGVHSPFGLQTEYDTEWVGRYHAVKSELTTVQITPAISRRFTENFSLGASLNILYADATLTNAIDFGTIGFGQLGPQTATALGLAPQRNDGFASVDGNDWGVGFTLGGAYRYGNDSRVGLAWKTQTQVDLRGSADFTVPSQALALTSTGLFTDQGARAGMD
ncbi:MAG: outer membrane protein transport protein, partial [Bdellovibrionales bacterium]|nr:outer membrane protein transport protein [Bdellovibrionales bacterium]